MKKATSVIIDDRIVNYNDILFKHQLAWNLYTVTIDL